MRKSRLEAIKEAKGYGKAKPALELEGLDGMLRLLLGGEPLPTQREVVYAPEEEVAYIGMVGAAKTSTLCARLWMRLLFEPGFKGFVGRKDYNDLKDTTLKRMQEMLDRLPAGTLVDRDKSAPMKWWIQPANGGDISEVTFLGLHDRPSGYEFNGGIVDECDEIDKSVMDELRSRCRLRTGHSRMIAIAFNPTDEDHWIYTECTGLNEKGEKVADPAFKLFQPKPGENDRNLYEGYYDSLRKRMSPDMAERLIEGRWGSSIKGTPVYGRAFKRDWHCRNRLLDYNPSLPIIRGHDFGYRHSFVIFAQVTPFGGLDVLWEMHGENVEIHDWIPAVLAETRTRFPDASRFIDWGDPAARQHKDTGSTLAALNNAGIMLKFIPGQKIDTGVRSIRLLLSRSIYGEPAFRIDRRCSITLRMLEKGYRYPEERERRSVERMDQPLKDGYFDHAADCARYLVMGVFGQTGGQGYDAADPVDATGAKIPASATLAGMYGLPRSMTYSAAADPIKNRNMR